MHPTRTMILAALAVTALTAACTRAVVYQERDPKPVVVQAEKHDNGPPPHAPAHGYRHKHAKDDVTLVYDTDIDVYVVTGYPGCYFSAGQYYRDSGNAWEWSVRVEGPWKPVKSSTDVPPGLRAKGHEHGKKHANKNEGKGKNK